MVDRFYGFVVGVCAGSESRRPVESKVKVFTSPSLPWVGIVLPLREKLRPAALPVLTTISFVARTEVPAGAIRVSVATGLPSAVIEIQEVSVARMTRVNVGSGFDAAA